MLTVKTARLGCLSVFRPCLTYCSYFLCQIRHGLTRSMEVHSLPPVLCIQLVRFSTVVVDGHAPAAYKNASDVIMPLRGLDAADLSSSYEPDTRLYDLVAVCNHTGTSMHSGALQMFVLHFKRHPCSPLQGTTQHLYSMENTGPCTMMVQRPTGYQQKPSTVKGSVSTSAAIPVGLV
jgi:hypothetical protein